MTIHTKFGIGKISWPKNIGTFLALVSIFFTDLHNYIVLLQLGLLFATFISFINPHEASNSSNFTWADLGSEKGRFFSLGSVT